MNAEGVEGGGIVGGRVMKIDEAVDRRSRPSAAAGNEYCCIEPEGHDANGGRTDTGLCKLTLASVIPGKTSGMGIYPLRIRFTLLGNISNTRKLSWWSWTVLDNLIVK